MTRDRRRPKAAQAIPKALAGLVLAGLTQPAATLAADLRARVSAAAVRPLNAGDERIVGAARQGARARLRSPECRKLLADLRDAEGRLLEPGDHAPGGPTLAQCPPSASSHPTKSRP
jgi:hypothetical protein